MKRLAIVDYPGPPRLDTSAHPIWHTIDPFGCLLPGQTPTPPVQLSDLLLPMGVLTGPPRRCPKVHIVNRIYVW